MASTMVSAGEMRRGSGSSHSQKAEVYDSLLRLFGWLEKEDYRGYDTFDGLNSVLLRPLTFETKFLRTVLQQGIRRFPLNLRPLVGVSKSHSTKAMGFVARGFIRLHRTTGDASWAAKAEQTLQWLVDHISPGFSGSCWGNHFDYQSRNSYVPKGLPSVVWTALVGHAFLDAYDHFGNEKYLQVADSACQHILRDISTRAGGRGLCISYFPTQDIQIHNASTLGASLLARTYSHTGEDAYRELAAKAILYTAQYQRPDGSWFYGEAQKLRWVDNFHSAYVLDCFKYYAAGTGDQSFEDQMMTGYNYWKKTFFLSDGTPRYYNYKTLPLDIQCSSQAIDTLMFFSDRDQEALPLALKVGLWTIRQMQDPTGYFYYRRYSSWLVNKTPTLHWGQATMLCALAGLYERMDQIN